MPASSRAMRKIAVVGVGFLAIATIVWWTRQNDAPIDRPSIAGGAPTVTEAHANTEVPPTSPTRSPRGARAQAPAAKVAPRSTAIDQPQPAGVPANPTRRDAGSVDIPIDREHATNLFADRIAKLEAASVDDIDDSDIHFALELRKFNARPAGAEFPQQIEQELRDHLANWLASFPAERVNHLALISVECRTGACQILIAGDAVDFSAKGIRGNSSFAATFEQSFFTLADNDWWQQLGLKIAGFFEKPAGEPQANTLGYALWTIYVSVPSPSTQAP